MNGREYLQPTLFDASEFQGPASHLPHHGEVASRRASYGLPGLLQGNKEFNPIHDSATASAINWSGPVGEPEQGKFIPVDRIVSGQTQVSRTAVDKLVNYSSGLDTPDILVREGEGEHAGTYAVRDGNHRVNAAIRRGQMVIPASVVRSREPRR